MNATDKYNGFEKIDSQLSSSYWVRDDDQHVYRHGRRWIRATVKDGVAGATSEYDTRHEAFDAE